MIKGTFVFSQQACRRDFCTFKSGIYKGSYASIAGMMEGRFIYESRLSRVDLHVDSRLEEILHIDSRYDRGIYFIFLGHA